MRKFVCDHPWTHFEVNNPNGDVTMCCDNDTVLGNVNKNSIEEIWNGKAFQDIRARMRDEGAQVMCPHTCPVMQGGKAYARLNWQEELPSGSPVRQNADLADKEYDQGLEAMKAKPRWLRFAYSYACNLDCYHCYQREDATQKIHLPDSFLADVRRHVDAAQIVFPFGGEPFLFKPVLDFLEGMSENWAGRLSFVTNGTLMSDRVFALLEGRDLAFVAVSLDAATEENFDALRKRGRKGEWQDVLQSLRRLQKLKAKQRFTFHTSMTVNSENYNEIEKFVDLSISFGAEPLLLLVSNPYQSYEFQRRYLMFTEPMFEEMEQQINRSLKKVRDIQYREAETYLHQLKTVLIEHRSGENRVGFYLFKTYGRKIFHSLPAFLRNPVRKLVQTHRTRRFEKNREHANIPENSY